MRKVLSYSIIFIITFSLIRPQEAKAQMPVKAKAFLTMATYGAAGGAMLGLASMAFGNSSRAVAQGASLGLYAGIIFGAYVLVSHHQRQAGYYDDDASPYQNSSDVYGDGYGSGEGAGGSGEDRDGGFFDRFRQMQQHVQQQSFTFQSEKRKGGNIPPISMNFLNLSF